MIPHEYPFTRYLSAKKSIDDRSINRHVWQCLSDQITAVGKPVRILEVGAGIGTMVERVLEHELLKKASYTLLDADPENTAQAAFRLPAWARDQGFQVEPCPPRDWLFTKGNQEVEVHLETASLYEFASSAHQPWDLLIAHHFLDLFDIPTVLPHLFHLLVPSGLFYFTLNFDGATVLEPSFDPNLDEQIERLYHQTMDERNVNGLPSGDSRTGRHMFTHFHTAGAQVLAAGSSDWVVFAGPQGYPGEDAFFLHFIIHTITGALTGHPDLDAGVLTAWSDARHALVERGELVLIVHQLDFLGRAPG